VDVLVLGAGLAGLRAALSALEARPGARVLVASATHKPSGSSFANQNDALGIHVCLTDAERQAYVAEVLALNRGAFLDPRLLDLQAREGAARLYDLEALGLDFTRDAGKALLPHSSCFSPHSRRAYIFTGLARAHARFMERLAALGCLFAPGWLAASILRGADAPGRARGAILVPAAGGAPAAVAAEAVVVALGGPARLFAHSMAGPNPGFGQGLLVLAGARMANQGCLQYMWGTKPGKRFWQPAELGQGGWRIVFSGEAGGDGGGPADVRREVPAEEAIPELAALCAQRLGHCPYGYGLPDSAVDLTLAQAMDDDGCVNLIRPDGQPLRVAPMAHASNGGAVIDEWGQTSVPGLFAVGECATGMHGANRIGGGMALATQVFGRRAGARAAEPACASPPHALGTEPLPPADQLIGDPAGRREGLAWLGRGLSRYAALGGRPGREEFAAELRQRQQTSLDWRLRLSLATAAGIMDGLPGAG
jgi:L-aspartate oxidase